MCPFGNWDPIKGCGKPIQVIVQAIADGTANCHPSRDEISFRVVEGDCPDLHGVGRAVYAAFALVDPAKAMVEIMLDRWANGDIEGVLALWQAGSGQSSMEYWFGDFEHENFFTIANVVLQLWARIVAGKHLVRCHTYGDNLWYTAGIIHLPVSFFEDWDTDDLRARVLAHEFCHQLEVLPLVPRDVRNDNCSGDNWYAHDICYGENGAQALLAASRDLAAENNDNYAYWMHGRFVELWNDGAESCANPWLL